MLSGTPAYRVWETIGYTPAVPVHFPDALIESLPPSSAVLEIGCHGGEASCYLARKRPDLRIRGIDINRAAIDGARQRAEREGLDNVRFDVGDVLDTGASSERFDCVMTLRVLTCFAELDEWHDLLAGIERLLHPCGQWYAVDYLYDAANPAYAGRYDAAEAAGMRRGNFSVNTKAGESMFVAHHHTANEIDRFHQHFDVDRFRIFHSLSMHGTPATMFELLGRKRPDASTPCYVFDAAPAAMRDAASAFRARFRIDFDTLTYFPESVLSEAHRKGVDEPELMQRVSIASERDPSVRECFDVLGRVANRPAPTLADRAAYFDALKRVYEHLDDRPAVADGVIVVAPEREGRILAESLGWLRLDRDQAPHAKRIPYAHGLLVGIGGSHPVAENARIAIVDGAIASGATILALLEQLARPGMRVDIYSVHAAREGLRTVVRFALRTGIDVHVHAGHVTAGLSAKFYAVDDGDGSLIVGDLGDTIEGVASEGPSAC
jgi:predicted O-methyltransferase YrrM